MANVAIIGAGMAGLAAAQFLLAKMDELGVTLFDASETVGGRALTANVGGEPIDWGCEALEAGLDSETTKALKDHGVEIAGPQERNPLHLRLGALYETDPFIDLDHEIYFETHANEIMEERTRAAGGRYEDHVAHPRRARNYDEDDSPTEGVELGPGAERIAALLSFYGGSFAESCILGESSAYDRGRSMSLQGELEDDDDDEEQDEAPYFAKGLGTAVHDWAEATVLTKARLTKKLGWPVGKVRKVGEEVEVVHTNGVAKMKFDAAIVTVPTPVIAGGLLEVEGMTKAQKQAFADCPLGHYHKIAVTGVGDVAGLARNRRVYVCDKDLKYAFFITSSAGGKYLMAHVAGEAGKKCNEDQQWARDTLLTMLDALNAAKVPRQNLAFYHSTWHSNPYIGGAYSYSKTGKGGARAILNGLSIGRVFFAGEACSLKWYGSLEGAMETGIGAAKRVKQLLG